MTGQDALAAAAASLAGQAVSAVEVLEQACVAKSDRLPCEDAVVVTPVLVAVVDGVTGKDGLAWPVAGREGTSGEWAASVVAAALGDVGPEWTARRAVDHLSAALAQATEVHPEVPRPVRPAASFAAVHLPRGELWAVGDCQWLVDGARTQRRKRVDELVADLRAATHAAIAAGASVDGSAGEDPGRELVLPFLRIQGALAGTTGEFGFGHLDGQPVLDAHLHVEPVAAGAQVVLATDGYPTLFDDLERTERALQEALDDDPQCLGPVLRGTKGLAAAARSYDDRAYVRVRLPGVPTQRTAAPAVADLPPLVAQIRDAVERHDFGDLRRLLDAASLPRGTVQPLHRLAHAGQLLVALDLEDLDQPPRVPQPLRDRLRSVALPQRPSREPVGLLASLRPTVSLVLEVIALHHGRRDLARLLAAVHLLAEALPLLAWEDVLGHAGDPRRLLQLAQRRGSRWGRDTCPTTGPAAKAARELRGAVDDEESWQQYLERSWSLVGDHLRECASCRVDCAVGRLAQPMAPDLVHRLKLVRVLERGPLLGLRHGSTVGHAFAVPGLAEVERAWEKTRQELALLAPIIAAPEAHPLPGLPALVAEVAGAALPEEGLLAQVQSDLLAAVGALAAQDVHARP